MVAGTKIRVFVISDQRMMRDALVAMLSGYAEIHVVGSRDGQSEALAPAKGSQSDVVVIHLAASRADNAAAVGQALHRWPRAKIVVLSPYFHQAFVAEVLRAGTRGYVATQCASPELIEAIRTVASGSAYLCSKVSQTVFEGFTQGEADKANCDRAAMTDRESTILHLFGEGCSSRDIAVMLNLSSKTIDACRRQLMRKLDVDNTAGLVKSAIALGLTTADPWSDARRGRVQVESEESGNDDGPAGTASTVPNDHSN